MAYMPGVAKLGVQPASPHPQDEYSFDKNKKKFVKIPNIIKKFFRQKSEPLSSSTSSNNVMTYIGSPSPREDRSSSSSDMQTISSSLSAGYSSSSTSIGYSSSGFGSLSSPSNSYIENIPPNSSSSGLPQLDLVNAVKEIQTKFEKEKNSELEELKTLLQDSIDSFYLDLPDDFYKNILKKQVETCLEPSFNEIKSLNLEFSSYELFVKIMAKRVLWYHIRYHPLTGEIIAQLNRISTRVSTYKTVLDEVSDLRNRIIEEPENLLKIVEAQEFLKWLIANLIEKKENEGIGKKNEALEILSTLNKRFQSYENEIECQFHEYLIDRIILHVRKELNRTFNYTAIVVLNELTSKSTIDKIIFSTLSKKSFATQENIKKNVLLLSSHKEKKIAFLEPFLRIIYSTAYDGQINSKKDEVIKTVVSTLSNEIHSEKELITNLSCFPILYSLCIIINLPKIFSKLFHFAVEEKILSSEITILKEFKFSITMISEHKIRSRCTIKVKWELIYDNNPNNLQTPEGNFQIIGIQWDSKAKLDDKKDILENILKLNQPNLTQKTYLDVNLPFINPYFD